METTSPIEIPNYPQSRVFQNWLELYGEYHSHFASAPSDQLWVFRGQSDARWPLATRLGRELEKLNRLPEEWGYLEEGLVREFQRRLPTADENIRTPEPDNILAWMALMQHHGTPTRLLDWTYSFFVALFFAVENASGDSAVFAIDGRWCNQRARQLLPHPESNHTEIAKDPYITTSGTFRSLFARNPEKSLVYRINPFVLNARLAVQQGLFLCPGTLTSNFEQNLLALRRDGTEHLPLHKWIIPKSLRDEVMFELAYMNIGRHSLFPGIDGFAQSLTSFLGHKDRLRPPWRKKQKSRPYENWLRWKEWGA